MCGILGLIDFKSFIKDGKKSIFRSALETLNHRGPDATGVYFNNNVIFGHKRLSIIDLSKTGNQPMSTGDGNFVIVYNGEIYDYKSLYPKIGSIKSKSDTEVILKGYMLHGTKFFKSLRGMYSFAIYDKKKGKIIICRDPSGIKPLYFFNDKNQLIFASEIKAIKYLVDERLEINDMILKSYLAFGYCIEPSTIYEKIKAVEPGTLIEVNLKHKKVLRKEFFQFDFFKTSSGNFIKETETNISRAIERNLVSDVPVNFALSGGIDSSIIVGIANKLGINPNILTIKFNTETYDESEIANNYAKILEAQIDTIETENKASLKVIDNLFLHFDQPYADSSAIPFYFLSKALKSKTKILIGGDGGDEIHNGYFSYRWLPIMWKMKKILPKSFFNLIYNISKDDNQKRKAIRLRDVIYAKNFSNAICNWQSWLPPNTLFKGKSPFLFNKNEIYNVFNNDFNDYGSADNRIQLVINYFKKRMLSDYLRKTDMMSMINSIEYRVPLLDEDLVQYSLSIPYSEKSNIFNSKIILRGIHKKLYSDYANNIPKSGFSIPLDKWLQKSDFSKMREVVLNNQSIVTNYINKEYIEDLFNSLGRNSQKYSRASVYQRILIFYNLQNWYEKSYLSKT